MQVRVFICRERLSVYAHISGYVCTLILHLHKIRNSAGHLTFINRAITYKMLIPAPAQFRGVASQRFLTPVSDSQAMPSLQQQHQAQGNPTSLVSNDIASKQAATQTSSGESQVLEPGQLRAPSSRRATRAIPQSSPSHLPPTSIPLPRPHTWPPQLPHSSSPILALYLMIL